MDRSTLYAYDNNAAVFAQDWHEQPPPSDMQALLLRYFQPGPTADIGCGSGRDTAWLDANGFPAVGYDASTGLLVEARQRYPDLDFQFSVLPGLEGVADGIFANVLCETVIMHLPAEDIAASVRRMLAILRPGGVIYLSWRVTEGADVRDSYGRLYAAFNPSLVFEGLDAAEILFDEQTDSLSSGKLIRRVIARKPG